MESKAAIFVKYLLYCFNIWLALSGVAFFVLGILFYLQVDVPYSEFVYERYQSTAVVAFALGIAIFCISFFGCYGAVKESQYMLIVFCVLLTMILSTEIAVGIMGYNQRTEVDIMLDNELNSTISKYYDDLVVKRCWDNVQQNLHCCGIRSPYDWGEVTHSDSLPNSCCLSTKGLKDNCTVNSATIFALPCMKQLGDHLKLYNSIVEALGLRVAVLQVFGAIIAVARIRHIHLGYERVK